MTKYSYRVGSGGVPGRSGLVAIRERKVSQGVWAVQHIRYLGNTPRAHRIAKLIGLL